MKHVNMYQNTRISYIHKPQEACYMSYARPNIVYCCMYVKCGQTYCSATGKSIPP